MGFRKNKKRKTREKCTKIPPNIMSTICDVNNLGSSNMSHAIACANESIFGHELENINYKPSPVKHAYECTTITYDVLTAMFLLYVNVPYRSKCITNDVLTAMFLLYVYGPYRSKCNPS